MIEWVKKTAIDVGTAAKIAAKDAMSTQAPIGKTVAGVLILEGVIVVAFLVTHKVKVITVLG